MGSVGDGLLGQTQRDRLINERLPEDFRFPHEIEIEAEQQARREAQEREERARIASLPKVVPDWLKKLREENQSKKQNQKQSGGKRRNKKQERQDTKNLNIKKQIKKIKKLLRNN